MVSRRGVELPLVGGPQSCGPRPSCAWISRALIYSQLYPIKFLFHHATNRFEYSLLPNSCEGEPAPKRTPAAAFPSPFGLLPLPKGNRIELLGGGSIGDVAAVEEPERGGCETS